MKPSKKQIGDSNKNKKQTQSDSSAKIKSYFKPAPKSFVVTDQIKENKPDDDAKKFYVQILKERLQGNNGTEIERLNETDGACGPIEQEPEIVSNENRSGGSALELEPKQKESEWETKYKELKKVYFKLTVNYAELDMKYKDLLSTVSGKNSATNSGSSTANATTEKSDGFLTSAEVKFLKCMPLEKQKDSTFVLQCLQFMYKDDYKIMISKSLMGTKESIEFKEDGTELHHPAKQPITPTKVKRIKELFVDRIGKCQINSVEYGVRITDTYINKLFASGIKNMAKKK